MSLSTDKGRDSSLGKIIAPGISKYHTREVQLETTLSTDYSIVLPYIGNIIF